MALCLPTLPATDSPGWFGYSGGLGSIAGVADSLILVRQKEPAEAAATSIGPKGVILIVVGWNCARRA